MSSLTVDEPVAATPIAVDLSRHAIHHPPAQELWCDEYRQFTLVKAVFSRTGGLALDNLVADRLRPHHEQPVSILAHWIVERRIVCFPYGSRTLVPMFQFDAGDMTLRAGMPEVLRELVDVFDDWELALWFARPNAWLNDAAPVDAIARDPVAVHRAARADRFIARG